MTELILGLALVAFVVWHGWMEDPNRGIKAGDRESPDPGLERAVRAAVGVLPEGLSLHASRSEWSSETGSGTVVGTRLVVKGIAPQLSISDHSWTDVDVGDTGLDSRFSLMGPPPLVRAILDAPARRALVAVLDQPIRKHSLKAADGGLQVDVWHRDADGLGLVARVLLAAAERLQAPADVPARLAAIARGDAIATVRLASLQTLIRDFPDHATTAASVRAACQDREGEVRLAAARALGEEGRPVMLALARGITDDECSAQAVENLRDATAAELAPILEAAQRPGRDGPLRPFTTRACVEALGRLGEEAVPLLDVALRSENEAVAIATIRTLRRIGGPSVVMSLQAAVEHHGRGDVRREAERALDDVQARLVGTPGQVSLAQGEAGQVALADDTAGQVSLDEARAPEAPATDRRRVVKQ
jgi:HEAT repeat protein